MPKLPKFRVRFRGVKDNKETEVDIEVRSPNMFSALYQARHQAILKGYKYTQIISREEIDDAGST